jgi:hypothetical protein
MAIIQLRGWFEKTIKEVRIKKKISIERYLLMFSLLYTYLARL